IVAGKYSAMFSQFDSGGANGSGGRRDEEEGADHQDDKDEDGDGDAYDSKYSDMFSQFESGGASGSGDCGDEEGGADHQDDEDEDGDGDAYDVSPTTSHRGSVSPRQVAGETPRMSLGKAVNVVVIDHGSLPGKQEILVTHQKNDHEQKVIARKEAKAEKEWEEKMKQEKAEYELFTLEFGVQSDPEYETD
nr:hypothetical protein [Tanacetum cinerariifolium]